MYTSLYISSEKMHHAKPLPSQRQVHIARKATLARVSHFLEAHKEDAELSYLKTHLKVSSSEIIAMFLFYDCHIFDYGNEIYDNLPIRFVQYIHSRSESSWHVEKAAIVEGHVFASEYDRILDIGFGIPSRYVRTAIASKSYGGRITLADKEESALAFARTLLRFTSSDWQANIDLKIMNLDRLQLTEQFDLYLLLDSIEHAQNPSASFRQIVSSAPNSATFLLSLPIGNGVPVHHIHWKSREEAEDWVRTHGCNVIDVREIHPRPGVDLFASALTSEFFEIVVKAQKTAQKSY